MVGDTICRHACWLIFPVAYENPFLGKAPATTLLQLRLFISAMLPIKVFDSRDLIELVSWIQMKNHRDYLSKTKACCVEGGTLCIVVGLMFPAIFVVTKGDLQVSVERLWAEQCCVPHRDKGEADFPMTDR